MQRVKCRRGENASGVEIGSVENVTMSDDCACRGATKMGEEGRGNVKEENAYISGVGGSSVRVTNCTIHINYYRRVS